MSRTLAVAGFFSLITAIVILTITMPSIISDENVFLKNFVNHEYIGFMGVLVTITLASAANIHIELNRYDEALGKSAFERSRADLRHSAMSLIVALCVALVTVLVKGSLPELPRWQAAVNGAAIITIAFSIVTVVDLTLAAFRLAPLPKKPGPPSS